MRRLGSIFPFLEHGVRHPHVGRLVANGRFVQALLRYGTFDEYVLGSPSRKNLREFREAVDAWLGPERASRVRCPELAEWPSVLAEPFHVVHLGGWGYFMAGLHYLRSQVATAPWPLTAVTHSLHGRETIDHAVRLASAELLPCDAVFCTSRDGRIALEHLLEGAAAISGRRFRGQLLLAPLGVDDALVDQPGDRLRARARLRLPSDALVVLALGRMSPAQKMDLGPICRMFAREVVPRVGDRAHLVFAGGASPAELDLVRESVRRHGLEHQVRLQANFSPEQKADVLAMADVLVAPADNT